MLSSSSSCLSFVKIIPTLLPQNRAQQPIFNQLTSPHSPCNSNHNNGLSIQTSRRKLLNIYTLTTLISSIAPCRFSWAELLELERYTDIYEGFTLLRPTSWIKVEKAGATVLFEDPSKGGNNVGVVVTPVRLTSLGEFGDPEFVSNKLVQAEKRKVSSIYLRY